MIDRLSIDKNVNDKIIPNIDEKKFMGLDKTNSDRIELFMFAMALGIKNQKRTPLRAKHGFILETSIKGFDGAMSSIYSLLVDELRKEHEEDCIDNKELAFKVAEEYANTGFNIIDAWMNSGKDEETLQYSLIEEMDSKFEEIQDMVI